AIFIPAPALNIGITDQFMERAVPDPSYATVAVNQDFSRHTEGVRCAFKVRELFNSLDLGADHHLCGAISAVFAYFLARLDITPDTGVNHQIGEIVTGHLHYERSSYDYALGPPRGVFRGFFQEQHRLPAWDLRVHGDPHLPSESIGDPDSLAN